MSENIFYKYRDLTNWYKVVDILVNERLYAPTYTQLNDPMEGAYYYLPGEVSVELRNKLKDKKERIRVVSLVTDPHSHVMWSHYGGGHSGIAIGLTVPTQQDDHGHDLGAPQEVKYVKELTIPEFSGTAAKNLLLRKLDVWSYENEYRVLLTRHQPKKLWYLDVKIHEIVFGKRCDPQHRRLVRRLMQRCYGNNDIKFTQIEQLSELH